MKQQDRRDTVEIGVCYESHIAGDRHPTQRAHRAHAERGKHEAGGGEAYSVDDRHVAHPIFLLAAPNSPRRWRAFILSPAQSRRAQFLGDLRRARLDWRDNWVGLERPATAWTHHVRDHPSE